MKHRSALTTLVISLLFTLFCTGSIQAAESGSIDNGGGISLSGNSERSDSADAVFSTNASSLIPLGIFKTTAYCPCYQCSEGWGRLTCTGNIANADHTIAVDPRVIPYGSKVMINGILYTAEDRGGGVRGNHIDIFFNTHGETIHYGTRSAEVFLVP